MGRNRFYTLVSPTGLLTPEQGSEPNGIVVQTADPRAPNPSLPLPHCVTSTNYLLGFHLFTCKNGGRYRVYLYGCREG